MIPVCIGDDAICVGEVLCKFWHNYKGWIIIKIGDNQASKLLLVNNIVREEFIDGQGAWNIGHNRYCITKIAYLIYPKFVIKFHIRNLLCEHFKISLFVDTLSAINGISSAENTLLYYTAIGNFTLKVNEMMN